MKTSVVKYIIVCAQKKSIEKHIVVDVEIFSQNRRKRKMNELFEILDELYGIEVQMESGIDILKSLEDLYMQKESEICEETGEMMKTSEERKIAIFSRSYMESMRKNLKDAIERLDETSIESLWEEHKRGK